MHPNPDCTNPGFISASKVQNFETLIASSEDDGDGDGDGVWVSSAPVVVGKVPMVLFGVCEDDAYHQRVCAWRCRKVAPRVSLASCTRASTISFRSLSAPVLSILRNLTLAASKFEAAGVEDCRFDRIVENSRDGFGLRQLMGVRSFVFRMLWKQGTFY